MNFNFSNKDIKEAIDKIKTEYARNFQDGKLVDKELQLITDFVKQYLTIKDFPEEKPEQVLIYHNFPDDATTSVTKHTTVDLFAEGFNKALQLCKLAHLKIIERDYVKSIIAETNTTVE